jgi:hypothetical protein
MYHCCIICNLLLLAQVHGLCIATMLTEPLDTCQLMPHMVLSHVLHLYFCRYMDYAKKPKTPPAAPNPEAHTLETRHEVCCGHSCKAPSCSTSC